ncbi:MAG: dihydroorotate dehydrogenase [Thermoleophilia bacterium]|nr:dihydroorotate dehydrogenase [Thermoleophilia bacterium]
MADLSVRLGPLQLEHPVINCSGTLEVFELADTFGPRFLDHLPVAAYVPKTVTLQPRAGNPLPRILETAAGMINAIGLPGPGLEAFVAQELPRLLSLPCPLILSVGGFSRGEYVTLASGLGEALDFACPEGWAAQVGLELNISCPNVHSGCASIGADPQEAEAVVGAVRAVWSGLLVAKLTPNVTDIAEIGRAAEAAGADAVAAVNTFKGLVIDRRTLRPYLGNITGGLSGPAIKPLALRAVYELFETVSIPIVGMGGIANTEDVIEFMACGATAVAVGSCGFRDPCLGRHSAQGLATALDERGLSVGDLVGCAHREL